MTGDEVGKPVVDMPVHADREVGPGLPKTVDEVLLMDAQSALPEGKD